MTEILVRLFVKDKDNIKDGRVRTAYGVLAGIVGIVCNILLCAGKMLIGMLVNSVAIIADAFNNLSDAASSIIGLVGVKLAEKPADEEHPFGHGRYEYIAALIVAFLILEVAINCFKSSFTKIIEPEEIGFSIASTAVLVLSVLVKVWLSVFNRKLGRKVDSKVMLATSKDAIGDVLVTLSTIAALAVFKIFGFNIDGYVGCAVSIVVFIAGIGIAKDTIEPLLGEAAPRELYEEICKKVESYDGIEGTHDLIVHSYGPTRRMATIHAEVRNDIDIEAAHETIDRIEREILDEKGIFLVIHMDPIEVCNETVLEYKQMMSTLLSQIEAKAQFHDFRVVNGVGQVNLVFDLVLPYSYKKEDEQKLLSTIMSRVREYDSRLQCVITVENSYVAEG